MTDIIFLKPKFISLNLLMMLAELTDFFIRLHISIELV